jgi:hypothetical protein
MRVWLGIVSVLLMTWSAGAWTGWYLHAVFNPCKLAGPVCTAGRACASN